MRYYGKNPSGSTCGLISIIILTWSLLLLVTILSVVGYRYIYIYIYIYVYIHVYVYIYISKLYLGFCSGTPTLE